MTDPRELVARLREIEQQRDGQWMVTLDERKRKELEFHDRHRDASKKEQLAPDAFDRIYGNKKYYGTVGLSSRHVEEWLQRHVRDKVFLDYACGDGAVSIRAAKAGARLAIGIDISAISIANARENARREGVEERTFFVQTDAEDTLLPESSVDVAICSGVLHHLDLSYAFPELRRILAPSGRVLAVEALNANPLIQAYRNLTPDMRTDWEKQHILGLQDVRFASRFFEVGEVRFWHITSILGAHVGVLLPLLNGLDRLLTRIPLVQRMAWMFTFELLSKKAQSP